MVCVAIISIEVDVYGFMTGKIVSLGIKPREQKIATMFASTKKLLFRLHNANALKSKIF